MKLVRWSPLEEMSILRDQIDRIFEPFTSNGDSRLLHFTVPVEVTETPKHYTVRAMVAGIEPDRIELQVTPKTLIISGELPPRDLEKDETVHLNEFQYGKFSKKLAFPENVDSEKVEADYRHGILEIRLPKAEFSNRRTIEIKVRK